MRNTILQIGIILIFVFHSACSTSTNADKPEIKDIQNRLEKIEIANKSLETDTSNILDDLQNNKTKLVSRIEVLSIALLSVLLFALLRKQVTKNKTDTIAKIQQTKKELQEDGLKLDSKLADLLATQMLLMKEERQAVPSTKAKVVNHELALKVNDEIVRIQKNLENMDTETKGLKQLVASVKRIKDNCEANGYELVEMVGKQYSTGMNVSVTFVPCENGEGKPMQIVGIIKPQVNFKGIMIQQAQIKVCSE